VASVACRSACDGTVAGQGTLVRRGVGRRYRGRVGIGTGVPGPRRRTLSARGRRVIDEFDDVHLDVDLHVDNLDLDDNFHHDDDPIHPARSGSRAGTGRGTGARTPRLRAGPRGRACM